MHLYEGLLKNQNSVAVALSTFEAQRDVRIKKLYRISNLAQMIGHIDNQSACALRDRILLSLSSLKLPRKVFDGFIRYVSR